MRGGQRRLVRPRRLARSLGRAHGPLLRLPCLLLHPSLSLFLFTGSVSTSLTERPLKDDSSPSSESSAASAGPCKGTKGTAPGSPGPGTTGAGIAGASGAVFTSVSLFVSILLFALLAQDSPRRAGCRAPGCCRHAEAVCLLLPEGFMSLSALVLPLLLLAAGVGFLLLAFEGQNVLLMKYNQYRITQARDEQVEVKKDQSMKGCSQKRVR